MHASSKAPFVRLLSITAHPPTLPVSSFLRTTFGLIIALLSLVLSPATALRAQDFALAESITGFVFTSAHYSATITREVAILSNDPTFNASSLTITQSAPGWLVPSLSADGRTLRLTASYSGDAERTTVVTIRSATKTVNLTVQSTYVASYRTPKTLLSADKTKLHVLYYNKILTLNPVTREILARASIKLPSTATDPTIGTRQFSFSPNGSQLLVFLFRPSHAVPPFGRHPRAASTHDVALGSQPHLRRRKSRPPILRPLWRSIGESDILLLLPKHH